MVGNGFKESGSVLLEGFFLYDANGYREYLPGDWEWVYVTDINNQGLIIGNKGSYNGGPSQTPFIFDGLNYTILPVQAPCSWIEPQGINKDGIVVEYCLFWDTQEGNSH